MQNVRAVNDRWLCSRGKDGPGTVSKEAVEDVQSKRRKLGEVLVRASDLQAQSEIEERMITYA